MGFSQEEILEMKQLILEVMSGIIEDGAAPPPVPVDVSSGDWYEWITGLKNEIATIEPLTVEAVLNLLHTYCQGGDDTPPERAIYLIGKLCEWALSEEKPWWHIEVPADAMIHDMWVHAGYEERAGGIRDGKLFDILSWAPMKYAPSIQGLLGFWPAMVWKSACGALARVAKCYGEALGPATAEYRQDVRDGIQGDPDKQWSFPGQGG